MKYLYVILSFLLTSCFTSTRTISYDPSYQSTTVVVPYTPPRPFGWWFRPSYLWQPRPFNPYYVPTYIPPRPFYVPPRPRHQFQQHNGNSGPRGGRRK